MTGNGPITPPRRRWGSRRAAWKQNRLAWSLRRAGRPTHAAGVPELVIEGLREDDARALLDAVLTGLSARRGPATHCATGGYDRGPSGMTMARMQRRK